MPRLFLRKHLEIPRNIQIVKNKLENISKETISMKTIGDGSKMIEFKDENGDFIPLSDFEKATGIKIYGKLQNYLDSEDYRIFYCPTENNEKEFSVYFGENVQKAYSNLFPDTILWMKDWEKTMLQDLHAILFPGIVFNDGDLNQNLQFKDGKYRYADIRLPDGKKGSINYFISENGVIVSSSLPCMDEMVEIYEPLQP